MPTTIEKEYWRKYEKSEKRILYRKKYNKMWYEKNRVSQKEHSKKQYRARGRFQYMAYWANKWYKNGEISAFDIWKIAKKQKLRCALSGEKLTSENASLDHILPKSKGGLNTVSNIRLTTKNINMARKNLSDEEFIELCKKVSNYGIRKS